MRKKCLVVLIFFLLFCVAVSAQIRYLQSPKTFNRIVSEIPAVKLNITDKKKKSFLKTKEAARKFKKDIFAVAFDTVLTPEENGIWLKTSSGKKIWTLAFSSEHAASINLIFSSVYLTPGVRLYVSDSLGEAIQGPYTFRNNSPDSIFAVSPIYSGYIIVELEMDKTVDDYGSLCISRIGVELDFAAKQKSATDRWYGTSADCNMDVQCVDNRNVQYQKYATVRYIYGGTERCTGTLVNNTNTDKKPYVLTAGHCIQSRYQAQTAVFYFNYVSPECEGEDTEELYSISGAQLLSRSSTIDYALLQLNNTPPLHYKPFFSGWDASGIPSDSTYTLHHPMGDVMKIAYNEDEIETGDASDLGYMPNRHWLVEDYEKGSTEAGSSGAALFSKYNKLLGFLSGGKDVCTPQIDDVYQKLSDVWEMPGEEGHYVKQWLDPLQKNQLIVGNYDPYSIYRTKAETVFNYDTSLAIKSVVYDTSLGYIAGNNTRQQHTFAEKFTVNGYKYIDAVFLNPAVVEYMNANTSFDLKIWDDTDKVIYSEKIYYWELTENEYNSITLNQPVAVKYNFKIGVTINYNTQADLSLNYTTSEMKNSAFTYVDNTWIPLGVDEEKVSVSLLIGAVVFDFLPDIDNKDYLSRLDEKLIYPNPTTGNLHVLLKNKSDKNVHIMIYNLSGQLMYTNYFYQSGINIPLDISDYPAGLYCIKINYENFNTVERVIKIN